MSFLRKICEFFFGPLRCERCGSPYSVNTIPDPYVEALGDVKDVPLVTLCADCESDVVQSI